jgi:hypothetical protein
LLLLLEWEVKEPGERLGCVEPIGRIDRFDCACFEVVRRKVYEIGYLPFRGCSAEIPGLQRIKDGLLSLFTRE